MIPVTERIRQSLVSLHMACALETLDQVLSRLEKGEMTATEAIDALLAEGNHPDVGSAIRRGRSSGFGLLRSDGFREGRGRGRGHRPCRAGPG